METWYTDNQNYNADEDQLKDIEESLNSTPGTFTVTPGADSYTLSVISKTKNTFTIAKAADHRCRDAYLRHHGRRHDQGRLPDQR